MAKTIRMKVLREFRERVIKETPRFEPQPQNCGARDVFKANPDIPRK
jgi:hypothetical protein